MSLINRLLRISPIKPGVNHEPSQDIEKDTQQTRELSQEATYNGLITSPGVSPGFKISGHGLKQTFLRGLPTHQSSVYRGLPIISGILIPFSILLSIPSLTDRWYIRTDANNVTLETHPNALLLNLGMGFSMACGVLANVCLIVRFSERKVLKMTWLCIIFLTLHGECQLIYTVSFIN